MVKSALNASGDAATRDRLISSEELTPLAAQVAAMRVELREIKRLIQQGARIERGFLDARAAAVYCGISRGTFDKYRYSTEVKLKGYRLDGKVLYKREELDAFITLYEIKSASVR